MSIGKNWKNKNLSYLEPFQKKIFVIYLNRDYIEQHYVYEKFFAETRLKIFSKLLKINSIPCDSVFEIITALGNLRYRLQDFSILEVCEKELKSLSDNISVLLSQKNISNSDFENLLTSIHSFESIFRRTLQVVCREPLDFLIFIQNLYDLHAELKLIRVV